jgi:hypothetical protein
MNYADLLEVAPSAGDALAFRARTDRSEYVVTGEVAGAALGDTPADGDRVLEFAVDEFLKLEDGHPHPAREWLIDLAPVQPFPDEPPRPAPLPALVYRDDLPLGVSLPSPQVGGRPKRVELYDTRPRGTPVNLIAGHMVDARDVLPADLATGEVIL